MLRIIAFRATGLPGAGGSRDEEVGHTGQVHDHGLTAMSLPRPRGDRRTCSGHSRGAEDLAQVDQLDLFVRDLEADDGFPGDDLDNPHAHRRQRSGEVLGQGGDPAHLQARRWLKLEAGDDRPGVDGHHLYVDPEVAQLDFHLPGPRPTSRAAGRRAGRAGRAPAAGGPPARRERSAAPGWREGSARSRPAPARCAAAACVSGCAGSSPPPSAPAPGVRGETSRRSRRRSDRPATEANRDRVRRPVASMTVSQTPGSTAPSPRAACPA